MTEENQNPPENPQSNQEVESLKKVVEQQSETIKQMNEGFATKINELQSTFNQSLKEVTSAKAAPKEEPNSEDSDDWWAGWDKDTQNVVKKEAERTAKQVGTEVESKVMSKVSQLDKKRNRDYQATQEFPALSDPESDFYKAWIKEYVKRCEEDDKFAHSVDGIYDTAFFTYGKMVKDGKEFPKEIASEAKRLIGITDSEMPPIRPKKPEKAEEMSPSQNYWAQRLGVSTENYLKRLREEG